VRVEVDAGALADLAKAGLGVVGPLLEEGEQVEQRCMRRDVLACAPERA
jgi:hypothetical protein